MNSAQIVNNLLEDDDFDMEAELLAMSTVLIHREAELTPHRRLYWRKFADSWVGKTCGLIDPWRTDVRELRKLYPAGTVVYQASTGGKYGKSSRRITL